MATGQGYDPALERLDLAVRAAGLLCTGRWQLSHDIDPTSLGILPEYRALVREALLRIDRPHTEVGAVELMTLCPFLKEIGLLLMSLYAVKFSGSRHYHYQQHRKRVS